ncbi:hypothetical protein A3Q56_04728, partial [Intoshia linei]
LFAPNGILLRELTSFLKSRQNVLAKECFTRLEKTLRNGQRKYPPHTIEIQAIQRRTTRITHKVYFPNLTDERFEVDSGSRAINLCQDICHKLKLQNYNGFSLFVKIADKVISVPNDDFFFDFVRHLDDWIRKSKPLNGANSIFYVYQVFFMKKIWSQTVPGHDVNADLIFHYHQELPKYLKGYHDINLVQGANLGAHIYRAKCGNSTDTSQINNVLSEIIPKNLLRAQSLEKWFKDVSKLYLQNNSHGCEDAKHCFLRILYDLPTFGSSFFEVKQTTDPSIDTNIIIAINKKGVFLINAETKKIQINYDFNKISNWSSGNTYFHMTIGNIIKGTKLLCETNLGYKIDDLLTSYISDMLGKTKEVSNVEKLINEKGDQKVNGRTKVKSLNQSLNERQVLKELTIDNDCDSGSDDVIVKKRKRIIMESDSEDLDFESDVEFNETSNKKAKNYDMSEYSLNESNISTHEKIIKKNKILNKTKSVENKYGEKHHLSMWFLKNDKIRDANGRSKNDPEYDFRTLFVPSSFMSSITPTNRQWWEVKSKNFDAILFFKIGKFYELLHMDALIGVKELSLSLMRGEYSHAGFPEMSFGRFAEILITRGYKVLRVEQTETVTKMNERMKSSVKGKKCVNREVCQVLTSGTRTASVFTPLSQYKYKSNYLMAICESKPDDSHEFGVMCLDTSIGHFYVASFKDDRHTSKLRTMISRFKPSQVLIERTNYSENFKTMLKTNLSHVYIEKLKKNTEFMSFDAAINAIRNNSCLYWPNSKENESDLPQYVFDVLKGVIDPTKLKKLEIQCLGSILWYLKRCLIDEQIFSSAVFEQVDMDQFDSQNSHNLNNMVLDSVTLANLELLENNTDKSTNYTMMGVLNRCSTKFGQRLLKNWISQPLYNPKYINERLDAVTELIQNKECMNGWIEILKKFPDMCRLLSRINVYGTKKHVNHPDNRAVLFSQNIYNKRKIKEFIRLIHSFDKSLELVKSIRTILSDESSILLKKLFDSKLECMYPDIEEKILFFKTFFDHEHALKTGNIIPKPGVNKRYDQEIMEFEECIDEIEEYKNGLEREYGTKIKYTTSGKVRFQLEFPATIKVDDRFTLTSSKKGFKRYHTEHIKELAVKLADIEVKKDVALSESMQVAFAQFYSDISIWSRVVESISIFDVLLSFALISMNDKFSKPHLEMCRKDKNHQCCIHIEEGYHPYLVDSPEFIPNDTFLNVTINDKFHGNFLMITGPNMGGKSTLMRQVGLMVIMAQLGCYVPAAVYKACPVDRVFTRLGASDRILSGESTFFVELSETGCMLDHATNQSLVLLDELGRGTSTYDGVSIAYAVVNQINTIKCRTLFSTHYHSLIDDFKDNQNMDQAHMSYLKNDADDVKEITFLYKLAQGPCDLSYGFNSAAMAGIPLEIINVAKSKACEFQEERYILEATRLLLSTQNFKDNINLNQIISIIDKLCIN